MVKKRLTIFVVMILIILTFMIQGCTPTPLETESQLSQALETFESPTFMCNAPDNEIRRCQMKSTEYLVLTVFVPKQESQISVYVKEVPLANKGEVLRAKTVIEINKLVANFEVKNAETNEIITQFDPPLELRLNFTTEQWEEWTKASGSDRPRLAYLVWKGDRWAEAWQEFTEKDIVQVVKPGEDEKYPDSGFLIIQIKEWGDPLIGGT